MVDLSEKVFYYIVKSFEKERGRKMKKYGCMVCGYVYNPELGDPEQDIPKKTEFDELPEDWACPDCGADKSQFESL